MKTSNRATAIKTRLIIALLFYCSAVGFSPRENPEGKTWIDFVVGLGTYTHIIRDCSGNKLRQDDYPYVDWGTSIHHDFGLLRISGRIGGINITRNTTFIGINYHEDPLDDLSYSSLYGGGSIGLNAPYFGLDLGVLYFDKLHRWYLPVQNSHFQPTGKLRIGYEDSWYFSFSLLNNTTMISQGGEIDMGLGFRFKGTKSSMWTGISAGPYDAIRYVLRTSIEPADWKIAILLAGDFGSPESGPEYGFSAGVRVKFQ